MEKFKGYEIYYDKELERFTADKKDLDIHFEARTLWEIKGYIKETRTEEVNKEYIIKSGYFGNALSKIKILTMNKATKNIKYKILDTTDIEYDIGKIKEDNDLGKLYEMSEHNLKVYDEIVMLQKNINGIENEQKRKVLTLK